MFKSYLWNGIQTFWINDIHREIIEMHCGFPQGTVLDSILFNGLLNAGENYTFFSWHCFNN